ncbi:MAG: serine hydrolase [Solirubrobacterales bacterium]
MTSRTFIGIHPPSRLPLVAALLILSCAAFLGFASTSIAAPAASTSGGFGNGDCQITPKPPAGSTAPFDGVCDYLATRDGVVQAAIFDDRTNDTYVLSTGDDIQYTASIVKVNILARWLRNYQRQGTKIPDGIPYSVKYLMARMIQNSDNAAATALFHFGGGCKSLTNFNQLIPMNDTDVICESPNYYGWGNTQTTAADQLKLMKLYAYGGNQRVLLGASKKALKKCKRLNRPAKRKACARKVKRRLNQQANTPILSQASRDFANGLMQGVESDQRFGITCGPWGTICERPDFAVPDPDVTVRVKNGWKTLPTCTDPIPQCPWQVNSTGWVRGKGRDYAMSVLTTRNPVGTGDTFGFDYGISTIQGISKQVWTNLGS